MTAHRRLLGLLLPALLLCAAPSAALATTQVGVAAAVRGSVKLVRSAAVGTEIQSGAKLFLDDQITTGPDAGLQILLLDETVFTLGPNSQMTIDTFVYDPAGEGKLDAKLVKGAFRFISGRVARRDPRQMNVELPSGTIGIRGTIVFALVEPDSGRSTVVLSGPGEGNTTGEAAGAIEVTNEGTTQEVLKSGWGVEVPGHGQPPSEPFQVPSDFYNALQLDVAPPPAPDTADEDSGDSEESEASAAPGDPDGDSEGDSTADSDSGSDSQSSEGSDADGELESSPAAESGAQLESASVAAASDQVLLDSLSNVELPPADPSPPSGTTPPTGPPPAFTPTLISEIQALGATFFGQYVYQITDAPLASGGDFNLLVNLDFGQQVLNVQLSFVSSPILNTSNIGFGSTTVNVDNEGIEASYDLRFMFMDSVATSCLPSGCVADVQLLFENVDVQIAGVVSGNVTLTSPQLSISDTGVVDDFPITTIQP